MARRIFFWLLILVALLSFIYFGGGALLQDLGERCQRLERGMKGMLHAAGQQYDHLRGRVEQLPKEVERQTHNAEKAKPVAPSPNSPKH